jgi:hypothetical protein
MCLISTSVEFGPHDMLRPHVRLPLPSPWAGTQAIVHVLELMAASGFRLPLQLQGERATKSAREQSFQCSSETRKHVERRSWSAFLTQSIRRLET